MKVITTNDKATIEGLPRGNIILFFAKVDMDFGYPLGYIDYCVVFGPEDKCLPTEDNPIKELWNAKVGLGLKNQEMKIYEVKHGHKYYQGGGFVETKEGLYQVFFRLKDNEKPSTMEGRPIIKENVFIVI